MSGVIGLQPGSKIRVVPYDEGRVQLWRIQVSRPGCHWYTLRAPRFLDYFNAKSWVAKQGLAGQEVARG